MQKGILLALGRGFVNGALLLGIAYAVVAPLICSLMGEWPTPRGAFTAVLYVGLYGGVAGTVAEIVSHIKQHMKKRSAERNSTADGPSKRLEV